MPTDAQTHSPPFINADPDRWLTLQQGAAYAQCHEATLRRLVKRGLLRHARVGAGRKIIRLRRSWIDEALVACATRPVRLRRPGRVVASGPRAPRMTLETFLARLKGVRTNWQGYVARCPAHSDHNQSLSVRVGDGNRLLVKCFTGCSVEAITDALGLTLADLFSGPSQRTQSVPVAEYEYRDEQGQLLFVVERRSDKTFPVRRPDGSGGWVWGLSKTRRVVYRLPELAGRRSVAIAEGEKDVDTLWALGLPATCNPGGASVSLDWPKWKPEFTEQLVQAGVKVVCVFPDCDDAGRVHADHVARSCHAAGLAVRVVSLPNLPEHGDVSDFLDVHSKADLLDCIAGTPSYQLSMMSTDAASVPPAPVTSPCTLADVDALFTRWLGTEYDLDALHAVLAAAAAERLSGDPLWLLVVSGAGNAKTETVQSLAGAGALVTSTISSEGALLSATARRERTKEATGGLLRRLGDHGLLVVKDVTSILSMNRDTRASLLAALREIHDGKWERNVGTDGGRSLTWTGRLVILGAVTTAWDRAHDVIASMGDRFVVVRMDSTTGRLPAGRRACRNTGEETQMRAALAAIVGSVLATVDAQSAITLTDAEQERLLEAADVVTLARTGVDYDYRGDVIDAHAPEMPTRFAKQLTQLVRGAAALGIARDAALRLAIRCARDSMPPLRLAILDDIAAHPHSKISDVRRRLEKPRATVDRQLQSLHMLNVLTCEEEEGTHRGEPVTRWRYKLAPGIDPFVLDPDSVPEKSPHTQRHKGREAERSSVHTY